MLHKSVPAEILLLQFLFLDHRTHRAIENENSLGQQAFQLSYFFRVFEWSISHDLMADSDKMEKLGVRFSTADTVQVLTRKPARVQNASNACVVKPRLTWL